ncbi:CPBP family intramembrane metalloprotease [Candidatus Micrarchaeota archaeon]|nr:CPBP family intramembrane metalloprotease [Candidatus Micrarchaeota archaeon]
MRKIKKIDFVKIVFFNLLLIIVANLSVLFSNFFGISNILSGYSGYVVSLVPPVILLGFIFLDKFIEKGRMSDYGFRSFNLHHLDLILYALLILFPISFASRVLLPGFDFWYSDFMPFSNLSILVIFLIFAMPLAVITEELGERALFQSRISKFFGSNTAVYVVTLNFVILHTPLLLTAKPEYQLLMLVNWLAYAFMISLIFEYTKSVYSTILFHFLANLINSIQMFLHVNLMLIPEAVLWSVWATLFIITLRSIVRELSRKRRSPSLHEISWMQKFYLLFLSILYPISIELGGDDAARYTLFIILLASIMLYYIKDLLVSFTKGQRT